MCPCTGRILGRFCLYEASHQIPQGAPGWGWGGPGSLSRRHSWRQKLNTSCKSSVRVQELLGTQDEESLPWQAVIFSPRGTKHHPHLHGALRMYEPRCPWKCALLQLGAWLWAQLTGAKSPRHAPRARPGFPASGSARKRILTSIHSASLLSSSCAPRSVQNHLPSWGSCL